MRVVQNLVQWLIQRGAKVHFVNFLIFKRDGKNNTVRRAIGALGKIADPRLSAKLVGVIS
jgi:hypothetical protein